MSTRYSGTEKRRDRRISWHAPVLVTRDDIQAKGEIQNISLGGILVSTDLDLKYGQEVTVQFSVPKMQVPVMAQCKVRWISGVRDHGLNFIGLKAIETWAISQLMRQIEAQRTD